MTTSRGRRILAVAIALVVCGSWNAGALASPPAIAKTSASWLHLTPGSRGIATQDAVIAASFRSNARASRTPSDSSIDGIVVDVERDFEAHRQQVLAALEDGLVVVLDSSGSDGAQARIQALSHEFANIGVKAAAVMLYKGGPQENVGLFPFGADEKEELATLMKKVARRGSAPRKAP